MDPEQLPAPSEEAAPWGHWSRARLSMLKASFYRVPTLPSGMCFLYWEQSSKCWIHACLSYGLSFPAAFSLASDRWLQLSFLPPSIFPNCKQTSMLSKVQWERVGYEPHALGSKPASLTHQPVHDTKINFSEHCFPQLQVEIMVAFALQVLCEV